MSFSDAARLFLFNQADRSGKSITRAFICLVKSLKFSGSLFPASLILSAKDLLFKSIAQGINSPCVMLCNILDSIFALFQLSEQVSIFQFNIISEAV